MNPHTDSPLLNQQRISNESEIAKSVYGARASFMATQKGKVLDRSRNRITGWNEAGPQQTGLVARI